ncbi:MAG TPA: hypothetical protein DCY75_06310, partial [Clostridiales bacterium]|nr:hypothetical protein [Clostridiales bacterium]
MLSDVEIASRTHMLPIAKIAFSAGIQPDELELYGHYKAKIRES